MLKYKRRCYYFWGYYTQNNKYKLKERIEKQRNQGHRYYVLRKEKGWELWTTKPKYF